MDRKTHVISDLVFYHFQGVVNLDRYHIYISPLISSWRIDKKMVLKLYLDYLTKIENAKNMIYDNYGFLPIVFKYISDEQHSNKLRLKKMLMHPLRFIYSIFHRLNLFFIKQTRKRISLVDVRKLY